MGSSHTVKRPVLQENVVAVGLHQTNYQNNLCINTEKRRKQNDGKAIETKTTSLLGQESYILNSWRIVYKCHSDFPCSGAAP